MSQDGVPGSKVMGFFRVVIVGSSTLPDPIPALAGGSLLTRFGGGKSDQ